MRGAKVTQRLVTARCNHHLLGLRKEVREEMLLEPSQLVLPGRR